MAAKKERFRTAIDDIEEAVKIGDKMNNTRVTTRGEKPNSTNNRQSIFCRAGDESDQRPCRAIKRKAVGLK